jgi:hypothetical protein
MLTSRRSSVRPPLYRPARYWANRAASSLCVSISLKNISRSRARPSRVAMSCARCGRLPRHAPHPTSRGSLIQRCAAPPSHIVPTPSPHCARSSSLHAAQPSPVYADVLLGCCRRATSARTCSDESACCKRTFQVFQTF